MAVLFHDPLSNAHQDGRLLAVTSSIAGRSDSRSAGLPNDVSLGREVRIGLVKADLAILIESRPGQQVVERTEQRPRP